MFVTAILEGNQWVHADLWTIMFSMFSGYMLVNAGPGAIINFFIILKELTLN
jgi:kynureninase